MTASLRQQAELSKIERKSNFGHVGYNAALCAVRSQSSTSSRTRAGQSKRTESIE